MSPLLHLFFILFLFALGACIGSFLNVVVWRLPRGLSLTSPPSHCPQCDHRLAWYDNIPVFGWLLLRGRCRYCAATISWRYPAVELFTAAMFVFYYIMYYMLHAGPCAPQPLPAGNPFLLARWIDRYPTGLLEHWPIYGLHMAMLCALLAASLIDIETSQIQLQIPWLVAALGLLVHALADAPDVPGALSLVAASGQPLVLPGALAAGGAVGLLASIVLLRAGRLPMSFPEGEPALEIDRDAWLAQVQQAQREHRPPPPEPRAWTRAQIRAEIGKEMLFLLPPLALAMLAGLLALGSAGFRAGMDAWMRADWAGGLLGSMLGALVGGLVVWLARILGTLAFGRIAMGLGDVHLMFGVGAAVGAGPATLAFFLAPFAGLVVGVYLWLTRSRRELPYGPYLALASAVVILAYCPIVRGWLGL